MDSSQFRNSWKTSFANIRESLPLFSHIEGYLKKIIPGEDSCCFSSTTFTGARFIHKKKLLPIKQKPSFHDGVILLVRFGRISHLNSFLPTDDDFTTLVIRWCFNECIPTDNEIRFFFRGSTQAHVLNIIQTILQRNSKLCWNVLPYLAFSGNTGLFDLPSDLNYLWNSRK